SADDLATSIHLPYGDPDGDGPQTASDDKHWREDFQRDPTQDQGRGFVRGQPTAVDAPYEWTNACNTSSDDAANDPGCTSRTSYKYFDSGWVKGESEAALVDPNSTRSVALAVDYDYDRRGNQTSWKTHNT